MDFLHVDASYFDTLDADCSIDTSTRSSDNDTVDDTDAEPHTSHATSKEPCNHFPAQWLIVFMLAHPPCIPAFTTPYDLCVGSDGDVHGMKSFFSTQSHTAATIVLSIAVATAASFDKNYPGLL